MAGKFVLVVDSDDPRRDRTLKILEGLSVNALSAQTGNQALTLIESADPDLILCDQQVSGHSAQELCEYVHEFSSGYVPFGLTISGDIQSPEQARLDCGADVVLVHPLGEHRLAMVCRMLFELSELKAYVTHLEDENSQLRSSVQGKVHLDPETQFYRFDLFKHVILMEMKKAKRYGFPLAMLLLAFDNYQSVAGWLNPNQRRSLFKLLRKVLVSNVRDIDIPLLFSQEKIIVVMPRTDLNSAVVVADRIRDRIRGIKPPRSLTQLNLSVSVSVSATGKNQEASFGQMVRQAVKGLAEAEMKGGDVVIVCRQPGSESSENTSPDAEPGGKLGPRTFFV